MMVTYLSKPSQSLSLSLVSMLFTHGKIEAELTLRACCSHDEDLRAVLLVRNRCFGLQELSPQPNQTSRLYSGSGRYTAVLLGMLHPMKDKSVP